MISGIFELKNLQSCREYTNVITWNEIYFFNYDKALKFYNLD